MSNQKPIFFLYRAKAFESNSSSSHSLVVNSNMRQMVLPIEVLDENGNIIIDMNKQACKNNTIFHTPILKIIYLSNMLIGCGNAYTFKMFIKALHELTQANRIVIKWHEHELLIHDGNELLKSVEVQYQENSDQYTLYTTTSSLTYSLLEAHNRNPTMYDLLLEEDDNDMLDEDWSRKIMNIVFDAHTYFQYQVSSYLPVLPQNSQLPIEIQESRQVFVDWYTWLFKRKGVDVAPELLDKLLTLNTTSYLKREQKEKRDWLPYTISPLDKEDDYLDLTIEMMKQHNQTMANVLLHIDKAYYLDLFDNIDTNDLNKVLATCPNAINKLLNWLNAYDKEADVKLYELKQNITYESSIMWCYSN